MKCSSCNSTKKMKAKPTVHKYIESGLDNITLNGVIQHHCGNCGEIYYDYGNINQLNSIIADTLLKKKNNLTGKEVRFLRTYAGYSSEMFARIIGLDKTSLSRIENGRAKVSNQVNMSVRFATGGKLTDRNYDLHDLILAIEAENYIEFKNTEFKISNKGNWQLKLTG